MRVKGRQKEESSKIQTVSFTSGSVVYSDTCLPLYLGTQLQKFMFNYP